MTTPHTHTTKHRSNRQPPHPTHHRAPTRTIHDAPYTAQRTRLNRRQHHHHLQYAFCPLHIQVRFRVRGLGQGTITVWLLRAQACNKARWCNPLVPSPVSCRTKPSSSIMSSAMPTVHLIVGKSDVIGRCDSPKASGWGGRLPSCSLPFATQSFTRCVVWSAAGLSPSSPPCLSRRAVPLSIALLSWCDGGRSEFDEFG